MTDLKKISRRIEQQLHSVFGELRSSVSEREDSRAFGAMIEERIADNWKQMEIECEPLSRPGRRTIFDFGFQKGDVLVGIDVKTKDLDTKRYSDGGVCAISSNFWRMTKGFF